MPIFALPLAFLGMLGVPAVAAIYLLRSRSRRFPVSSLMLWMDQQRPREGGLKVQKIQTPLLLVLELLAVACLVLAATNPRMSRHMLHRPLVVVLDDSYSMLAGGADSPRNQAAQTLKEHLASTPAFPVHLVLAGGEIQLLGEPIRAVSQVAPMLEKWTPQSPTASLAEAIALAKAIATQKARILVLTDHPPERDIEAGPLEWWAFGRQRPNAAIVNAARTGGPGGGRCLLEVANLAANARPVSILVRGLDDAGGAKRLDLSLAGGEVRRLMLKVTGGPRPLRVTLGDDALPIDNEVILLPGADKSIRVRLAVADKTIRQAVERALEATGQALLTDQRPQLVITDSISGGTAGLPSRGAQEPWPVRIIAERDAASFTGPFVVDYSHPLTDGLGLEGVAWGAGKSGRMPGAAVITAGNVPLVTDTERLSGVHEVRIQLRADLSTLIQSPNWPILIWNLLRYRGSTNPGLQRHNVRLGTDVVLRTREGAKDLRVLEPGRNVRGLSLRGRTVAIRARRAGLHEVYTSKGKYTFAANAMYRDESDLRACRRGKWGSWLDERTLRVEYKSIAWVFLLIALAALLGHMALLARSGAGMPR
ncbi:MAG: VWA domain-containing protein [Phycisphaerae bacterium]|nr:VWA domain-containing protein [Phycisphaerae bacterium]